MSKKAPEKSPFVDEKPVDNVDKSVDNPSKLVSVVWVKDFYVFFCQKQYISGGEFVVSP